MGIRVVRGCTRQGGQVFEWAARRTPALVVPGFLRVHTQSFKSNIGNLKSQIADRIKPAIRLVQVHLHQEQAVDRELLQAALEQFHGFHRVHVR